MTPTPSSTPTPNLNESPKTPDGDTLLAPKEPGAKPQGAPEKYEAFKLPEGVALEGDALTKAQELFKSTGLSQEAAQSMVDFHVAQLQAAADAPLQAYNAMREEWKTKANADPEIGPKAAAIRETLGRAFDTLGDPALVADFKAAMNLTGVGDHPAFIKVLNKMAASVVEGRHVSGAGPTKPSQQAPGAGPISVAKALYPNNA